MGDGSNRRPSLFQVRLKVGRRALTARIEVRILDLELGCKPACGLPFRREPAVFVWGLKTASFRAIVCETTSLRVAFLGRLPGSSERRKQQGGTKMFDNRGLSSLSGKTVAEVRVMKEYGGIPFTLEISFVDDPDRLLVSADKVHFDQYSSDPCLRVRVEHD